MLGWTASASPQAAKASRGDAKRKKNSLQLIQNKAIRLIGDYSYSVSHKIKTHELLNVNSIIIMSKLVFLFKQLNEIGPNVLDLELLGNRNERIRAQRLIKLEKVSNSIAERSLCYEAASQWNALPNYIRTETVLGKFKKLLKVHILRQQNC